jgi:phycocyanin-associated, rod
MTMNTAFNLSGNNGRSFAIDIAGSPDQAMLRSSAYTVKVAYSSLSQTIHSIGKRGGKVVNVRMLSAPMPGVENIPVASGTVAPVQAATQPQAKAIDDQPKGESNRLQSKSKKR